MSSSEEKQESILKATQREAETLKHGRLLIEYKVQDGKIMAGEVIEAHKKLG